MVKMMRPCIGLDRGERLTVETSNDASPETWLVVMCSSGARVLEIYVPDAAYAERLAQAINAAAEDKEPQS